MILVLYLKFNPTAAITIGGMDDTFGHTVTSANTTTGVSDQVLDSSDTSDDLDAWRIVGFSQEIDNDCRKC